MYANVIFVCDTDRLYDGKDLLHKSQMNPEQSPTDAFVQFEEIDVAISVDENKIVGEYFVKNYANFH